MLSAETVCNIFPFHVHLDGDLIITSVGKDLPRTLGLGPEDLIGKFVDSIFSFVEPHVTHWSRKCLKTLLEQDISIEPVLPSRALKSRLVFSGSITCTSNSQQSYLFILTPDTESMTQLNLRAPRYGLTGRDSRASGTMVPRRDCSTEHFTQKISSLTTELRKEQVLLESLMPKHAAEGLREGHHVDPIFHENVTMFFSDIVGFTRMCDQIFPWEIIGVLNRLYCIMDHLAKKFGLFKIETIGDAYVCAAGLPADDPKHAEKVATFAVAVSHCARHILSPVDGKPLQLRVGIHTGSCASGVVGVTNPRYCVFGDTVNITSRHESTGEADRVHTSQKTALELMSDCDDKFILTERGQVDMKGKGKLTTYWLAASETNEAVNAGGLATLDAEVKQVLYDADFGSKERCSQEKMADFSPAKMQKVALSLDKLAVDVLKKSSLVFPGSGDDKYDNDKCDNTCSSTRERSDSFSFEDLVGFEDLDEAKVPETTDTDTLQEQLSAMFRNLGELKNDEMKKGIVAKFAQMMDSKTFMELYDSSDF